VPEPEPIPLDVERMVRVLAEHAVTYIVIGGLAATLHGSPMVTFDVDIAPESSEDNLDRLAGALRALQARVRVSGLEYPVDVPLDARTFRSMSTLTARTAVGDLDIVLRPDGFPAGYVALAPTAEERTLFGVRVQVAALRDVIASKRAAGRPKDWWQLPELEALLEESGGS
jgi:hypothetical protein